MTMVTLDALNAGTDRDFVAALGDIFEHAPWIADAAAGQRPFHSLAQLFAAFGSVVRGASESRTLDMIRAHPDLAGKAARAGTLTRESTEEQASAGLDRLSDAEFERFRRLNEAYRARFEFPFILCVRRHTVDSILGEFERRFEHNAETERRTALDEILRIGALRLDQRVRAPDRLPVTGRLSTHVLDTHRGTPAEGVETALFELSSAGAARLIVRTATNADGRTDAPLIAGRPVPMGYYELRFEIGRYFTARGIQADGVSFLDVVPIRFGVAEPEGHYHVPLLVTPWSYTTYRGS